MKPTKYIKKHHFPLAFFGSLVLVFTFSCERFEEDLRPATFPNTSEIFINNFSAGLEYAAFGDSKVTAFTVDEKVSYEDVLGTSSMRFDIPNEGDPEGAYAGGVFRDLGGRDLSGYDALTFYAQASKPGTVNLIGFGNDFEDNKYSATTSFKLSTSWAKYIIPIPDPAKLTREKGLLILAEGPEDGDGYTIWLDVVKFEKLGTLAHPRPAILNGEDLTTQTYIGVSSTLTGLTQTMNLPNGADQTVNAAPAYFTFISSDTTVAKVNDLGNVTVVGQGTAKITAKLAGETAAGSLTVNSLGEFTHASIPDRDPENVISVFSDAYTNVPVDFYNGFFAPFQTTNGGADLLIGGDNIIRYTNLNFVATQFSQPTVNASEMTHLHVDIQVEDQLEEGDFIRIQLVDFGPDGAFDGGDDTNGSVTINNPPLETGNWVGLDIPLADFTGLTGRANLAQLFFVSDATISTILVDNIYFYNESGGGETPIHPSMPAPDPMEAQENVISIYSDVYNNVPVEGFNFYGSAAFEEVQIMGNGSLKYALIAGDGGNFQVIELGGENQIDALAAGMTNFRFDLWFPNNVSTGSAFLLKLVDIPGSGATEALININPSSEPEMVQGSWLQYDFPIAELENNGLGGTSNIQQVVVDLLSSGEVYIDNIYFYKNPTATEPVTAAPTPPTRDAADVISIFSDAYTDISGIDRNPNWGQSTLVSEVDVAGNNTLKYTNFNYQGTDFSGNAQDVSVMQYLHVDMWTADATDVKVTPVNGSGSPAESLVGLTPVTTGQWVSYDIPLADFTASGMTLDQVIQMKFDGQGGTTPSTIYLDNIYFYRETTATEPTAAAPTPPTRDAADVISIFSDAYTDISGIDRNPNWGQSTLVSEVDVAGNNTLKYTNFNYQGTDFSGNAQDVSGMQFLHIDMWTADATDVRVTPVNGSGSPAESLVGLTPVTTGQWVSYDIPLADFSAAGMTLDQVIQMKFDGQGGVTPSTIYLDNIYFYKAGSAGGAAILDLTFSDASSIDNWEKLSDANSTEASIEWISDGGVEGGAMQIAGSNTSDAAGKAYIFQLTSSDLNYDGATDVQLTFDLKLAAPLTAAAVHLQTDIPGTGVTNNFDLQNSGLNASTFTNYSFDFTGVDAGPGTFTIHFNMASGAVTGAGGTILVDNIKLIKK